MIRRPPRSTLSSSSAASDVYKRQLLPGLAPLVTLPCQTCPHVLRPPVVALLLPTCPHVPRSRDRPSVSAPTAPFCIPVSAPDSQSVSTDLFSADSHQSSMVTSQLSAQAEPFHHPVVDETSLPTDQCTLFTHTFTAESADVDQTLVKSAPHDELPDHVNLLFIQTTTEQNLPPDT